MRPPLKIAARGSPLSKVQVSEVVAQLEIECQTTYVSTSGDLDRKTSLRDLGKTDFFTKEVDALVLNSTCDIAIHSAKDLPEHLPEGLKIVAITRGEDPSDSLVMKTGLQPCDLKRIATSSQSRDQRSKILAPNACFVDIRGTIHERLQQLEEGVIDGVVIAEAALRRLKLDPHRVTLPGESTPLQGQLAIVARIEDRFIEELFAPLDSRPKQTLYFGLRCPNPLWHHAPLIQTRPLTFNLPIKPATHYLFTSPRAVDYFHSHLTPKPIFCIGKTTQRYLKERGFNSTCAEQEDLDGVIQMLESIDLSEAHLVWPRSQLSRDLMTIWLKNKGIECTEIPLYTTFSASYGLRDITPFQQLVFSSPSCVDAFLKHMDVTPKDKRLLEMVKNKQLVAIGPVTQSKINSCF